MVYGVGGCTRGMGRAAGRAVTGWARPALHDRGGAGQASEKIKSTIYKGDSRLGRLRGAWFLEKGTAFNVAFEALIGRSR